MLNNFLNVLPKIRPHDLTNLLRLSLHLLKIYATCDNFLLANLAFYRICYEALLLKIVVCFVLNVTDLKLN